MVVKAGICLLSSKLALPLLECELHLTLQTLVLTLRPCFADAADVEQAVRIAAAHNTTVAVKGGGWSWVRPVCYPAPYTV